MTPEQVLAHSPKMLTETQREAYFRDGYLLLERFVPDDWLATLRGLSERFIEESRRQTVSDDKFDLEPDHCATAPRLRRLTQPVAHHPDYWRFASDSIITDLAEDLLGPDVMFHHSKLNFKWSSGGEEVKWHQDIQYYPHTNYSVLAIGVYLEDVDDSMGPMGVIPGPTRASCSTSMTRTTVGPAPSVTATSRACRWRRRSTFRARPAR